MDDTSQLYTKRNKDYLVDVLDIFDENKCRNVLVRYCAHIPRNYQYRDGIRLVFLVLRDHLGDEFLGLAGGVLYEMIELDCHHSDDPGAAFQRWRYDHLNRYADLELPHVPHLTTVTSNIIPTSNLIQWRKGHPQRYHTRLSDYAPTTTRSSLYPSGIGIRKTWVIEHTMYVSSRNGGTHASRQLNASEFHEMQWNENICHKGRFVGEKSIDLDELPKRKISENLPEPLKEQVANHRRSSSLRPMGHGKMTQIVHKLLSMDKAAEEHGAQQPASEQNGRSAMLVHNISEQQLDSCDKGCEIPNANFARKFGLFTDNMQLPPFIKELPVAEDKAMNIATETPPKETLYSGRFQGPFTPQLWFDGGIDYRWKNSSC